MQTIYSHWGLELDYILRLFVFSQTYLKQTCKNKSLWAFKLVSSADLSLVLCIVTFFQHLVSFWARMILLFYSFHQFSTFPRFPQRTGVNFFCNEPRRCCMPWDSIFYIYIQITAPVVWILWGPKVSGKRFSVPLMCPLKNGSNSYLFRWNPELPQSVSQME